MKKFFVVTNRAKDPDWEYTDRISSYLEAHDSICMTQKEIKKNRDLLDIPSDFDCIIVLGGDGTLLQTARETHRLQIPLIGINLGTLGYLSDINKNNIEPALDKLMEDDYTIEHRMMLYGKVIRKGKVIAKDTALNDIVISREGYPKMIFLENYIQERLLNKYRADGVIIATATGSTGYSLSAGGPIIAPASDLFLITPLAPQSMINRSVIIPPDRGITVRLGMDKYGGKGNASVIFDGDTHIEISSGDEVQIRRSNKDTLIAKVSNTSFLDVLYEKMNPVSISEVLH